MAATGETDSYRNPSRPKNPYLPGNRPKDKKIAMSIANPKDIKQMKDNLGKIRKRNVANHAILTIGKPAKEKAFKDKYGVSPETYLKQFREQQKKK